MARSEDNDNDATGANSEEIKPYKIHISSKYLELTKQKLELTRLPHEGSSTKSEDWWEPKASVEPLIDFWLESYSWRNHESELNTSLSQFRTSIELPHSETPARLHFIHVKSPHANAVPLLLIPPFPFTNLSIGHLIPNLTDPDDASSEQPFHVVIPSLPGLGFSDALPNNTPMISTTAHMMDILMKRLDYEHYIATTTSIPLKVVSHIDWRIANKLALYYQDSCLGVHFINPPFSSPSRRNSPLEWSKWKLASWLKRPMLGYSAEDLQASRVSKPRSTLEKGYDGFISRSLATAEPNTLAYALCDSPTGLLVFFMMLLRVFGSRKEFSPLQMINLTALIWLPGPEATLRFWAHCAKHEDRPSTKTVAKPKVAITASLGEESEASDENAEASLLPRPLGEAYSCPIWGRTEYTVMSTKRVAGKAGLVAWESPQVVFDGARILAKAILATDKRMRAAPEPGTALLEQVVVEGDQRAPGEISGTTVQAGSASSSDLPRATSSLKDESTARKVEGLEVSTQDSTGHLRPVTPQTPLRRSVGSGSGASDEDDEAEESSPDTVIVAGSLNRSAAP